MIDSHCHLHYDYAPKSTEQLVAEAHAAGVQKLVTVGVDLDSLDVIASISERFESVFHTAGVHPHDATALVSGGADAMDRLRKAAQHPKCRAIGEIGMDYYYEHSDRGAQREAIERQLDLAIELKQPVVIHARDAESDLLEVLSNYSKKASLPHAIGAIHCFTGTYDFGKACIDLGFVISFSGIMTFKNAEDLRSSARAFPLDRLMVETDSPYLAPVPHRGKKCEPSMVVETAKLLAQLRGVALAEIDQATTATASALFRLT